MDIEQFGAARFRPVALSSAVCEAAVSQTRTSSMQSLSKQESIIWFVWDGDGRVRSRILGYYQA